MAFNCFANNIAVDSHADKHVDVMSTVVETSLLLL